MKYFISTLFFFSHIFLVGILHAQTLSEIKAQPEIYIWGEGGGTTLRVADQYALQFLIGQISTTVQSEFSYNYQGLNQKEFKEKVNIIINTYSQATLHNTERIVVSNEPDAWVFRYIKRSEIAKVFAERLEKIKSFASLAQAAEQNSQIADALRYYYWSLVLLKSHPEVNSAKYVNLQNNEVLLFTWLSAQMNRLFSEISISAGKSTENNNLKTLSLIVNIDGKPVSNFDYSYWNGRDWSPIISAKDGLAYAEFAGEKAELPELLKIKAEYIFESEAIIDRELQDVMSNVEPIPFRNSYFNVKTLASKTEVPKPKEDLGLFSSENTMFYAQIIQEITKAINSKQYSLVKNMFTNQGFDMFTKLISYGNAYVLDYQNIEIAKLNNKTVCRSLKMNFKFKNNKEFVESVVFHFNENNLIESITFGLSQNALTSILNNEYWDETSRLVLVDFLEHYKTAYALKRLDYLQSIFADDALIITGYILKVKSDPDNIYKKSEIVKYNRLTKEQYIKKLTYSFGSKEFINIKFEESKVKKGGIGNNIYGVQIKQNYYSSNYGDTGYLFLIVDLNNPQEPIIHVRTWQPNQNLKENLYNLSDF